MQVDVAKLIDDRPLTGFQVRVFVLCGLVAIFDGIDSQVIGVAGPLMAAQLGLSSASLAPVFASGLLGAAIGAVLFGPVADRYGRKPVLAFATALFGMFTCATAWAASVPILLTYRFIAGLGLGGAIPCFITLGAEYAPQRQRAKFTSLIWAGYPLGIAIGGFTSSFIVSRFEWPVLFYAAGVPTLVTSLLLVAFLPESLRFLVSKAKPEQQSARIVRKLSPSLAAGSFVLAARPDANAGRDKVSTLALFRQGRAPGTLLLGLTLLLAFLATTVVTVQVPTLLRAANVPVSTSAFLVGIYSLFAIAGMAVAGRLVEKFGASLVLATAYIGGALFLAALGIFAAFPVAAGFVMALLGMSIPLGVAGTISLSAIYYPTAMRSAGTGWAMGLGRFGQFLSPLAVGLMLYRGWAPAGVFYAMAIAPILAAACVAFHIALARKLAGSPEVLPAHSGSVIAKSAA